MRLSAVAVIAAAVLAPPGPVRAGDDLKVTVVAILAHNRDDKVDPRLKCVAEEVRKLVPLLTGFDAGRITCKHLPVGKPVKFELVDDQKVTVEVLQRTEDGTLQIKVSPPLMGDVTYETCCG